MNKFQPVRYIKRYAVIVFLLFFVPTVALFMFLKKRQSYTASAVIEYTYEGAQNGLFPDGSKMDVTEIYSSSVINQVLDYLGLDGGRYPIDSIRSAVTVTQLADKEVLRVNAARNEEGVASDLQSTRYEISYQPGAGKGKALTGAVLDAMIDAYFSQFSKQYVNRDAIVNSVSGINRAEYDYLEQIELIEVALDKTVQSLAGRAAANPDFYSTASGYSFQALADYFSILQNARLSSLSAYVLNHQVTKDRDVLLAKYQQRIQDCEFAKTENRIRLEDVEGILDAYVGKLRESDNTAQSAMTEGDWAVKNRNVLGDVETPNYLTGDGGGAIDQTTEYESLLKNWVKSSDAYNQSVVDAAYCQYVIDCFSGNASGVAAYQLEMAQVGGLARTAAFGSSLQPLPRPETAIQGMEGQDALNQEGADQGMAGQDAPDQEGTDQGAEGQDAPDQEGTDQGAAGQDTLIQEAGTRETPAADVFVQATTACTPEDIAYVERSLDQILSQMNHLYEIAQVTDDEFNEYLGAQYIQMISSNHVSAGLSVMRYTIVGALLFLAVSCMGAILLGRLGDIWQYMIYTDHRFGLPNRTANDRYIQKYKEKVLPAGFGCVFCQVTNQDEINREFGRESGDEALTQFARGLESIFHSPGDFIGYNGNNQFIVFTRGTDSGRLSRTMEDFRIFLRERFQEKGIVIKYLAGTAESASENLFQIQSLMGMAASRKQLFKTASGREDAHGSKKK